MPLFKKGDKSEVGNYRPVSLISCVGKAFARIIFKHVYNHIAEHSLLYKYQSWAFNCTPLTRSRASDMYCIRKL